MKLRRLFGAILLSSFLALRVDGANAREIVVFSTIAARSLLQQLGSTFETVSPHKLKLKFDTAAALKREIETGARFDVALLTEKVATDLEQEGKLVVRGRRPFAHVLLGLAVKTGGPKKEINSAGKFVEAISSAEKIAYAEDGASGAAFVRLLRKINLHDELRLVPMIGPLVMEAVAAGKVTYGVQLVSEIVSAPGVELVGPFPDQYQTVTELALGRSPETESTSAAVEFIAFMESKQATDAISAVGMIPN
jgi:molybdate transport system substrate-binding protein